MFCAKNEKVEKSNFLYVILYIKQQCVIQNGGMIDMNEFERAKNEYVMARNNERKRIISFLKENEFEVLNEFRGKGETRYTSGNRLNVPYDLSNWKWVEVKKGEWFYLISLQAFDRDPSSRNLHVLMDRIGVYKYEKYNSNEVLEKMKITDIELPMDKEKFDMLLDYLN